MSTKPNPVALTSAMLAQRNYSIAVSAGAVSKKLGLQEIAALASNLHRLGPACTRQALAECNGEWREGQRDRLTGPACAASLEYLDNSIRIAGERLDRRLERLCARLAPLSLLAVYHGDPRGCVLTLESADGLESWSIA